MGMLVIDLDKVKPKANSNDISNEIKKICDDMNNLIEKLQIDVKDLEQIRREVKNE